jgi:hypothetical protein
MESHDEHPLKPQNYQSVDGLCHRFGYAKSSIAMNFSWMIKQSNGSLAMQKHVLEYWLKDLIAAIDILQSRTLRINPRTEVVIEIIFFYVLY